MMLELDFMAALMVALSEQPGLRVWRQNTGSVETVRRRGGRVVGLGRFHAGPPKGAADITGIVAPDGLRLEIECKVRGQRPRPEQAAWARFVAQMGGVHVLVDCDPGAPLADEVHRARAAVHAAIAARRLRGAA